MDLTSPVLQFGEQRFPSSLRRPHAVTNATHVQNEVVSEFAAQAMDVHFDGVAFYFFAPAIEAFFDLRARKDVTGALHQELQEREFFRGQPDLPTLSGDPMGGRIEGNSEMLDLWRRAAGLSTQKRADAGGKLVEIERLYQIVVGAGVESLYAIGHGITGGNDEYRERLLARSQTLQHLQAPFSRQPEIQQQEVECVRAEHFVSRFTIVNPIHSEAVPLETRSDSLGDHGIIFY
jgi:hypothetical protein